METIELNHHTKIDGGYAATIGVFDGVHLGHRFLMEQLLQLAGKHGLKTMAITFARHPRQVVHSEWTPQLLTSLDEKKWMIETTGIDTLVVLDFDTGMAQLSAHDFMQQVLQRQLGVRALLTGYDNRFGSNRTETFDDYVEYGRRLNIDVVAGQPLLIDGDGVSSSKTRALLRDGLVDEARRLLGYPYSIWGTVVHGQQIGRTIGFPTANIRPDAPYKMVPKNGAYAIMAELEDGALRPGMMNIGTRPTFQGDTRTMEANIFDEIGDIYDRKIRIHFVERLRDERHFDSPEDLVRQLQEDRVTAMNINKR